MALTTDFFAQNFICYLTGFSPSHVSKFISARNYKPIEKNGEKRKKYDFETTSQIIFDMYTNRFKPTKKVQIFFNFKGGTGKTSLCYQISVLFALFGFKVLAIDCDPQGHLSYSLGFNENDDNKTLFDVIENSYPIQKTIKTIYPGYDAIPSNLSMTRLESHLIHKPARESVLKKIITPLTEVYDFIFIDTNPTISTLNHNAIFASDELNIICETQPYSLKGLELLIQELINLEKAMNVKFNYRIIANKFESKTATAQQVLGALRHNYNGKVMESIVRKCEDFNISAKKRSPVYMFRNKKSMAVEDIVELSKLLFTSSCDQKLDKNSEVNDAA